MISGDSIIKCLWSYIEMLFSFYDGGGGRAKWSHARVTAGKR